MPIIHIYVHTQYALSPSEGSDEEVSALEHIQLKFDPIVFDVLSMFPVKERWILMKRSVCLIVAVKERWVLMKRSVCLKLTYTG